MNSVIKVVAASVVLLLPRVAVAGDATTILGIDGMHCALCAPAVTKALKQIDGVKSVDVSVGEGTAVVVADNAVKSESLIAAVAKAGF
ncbi:MAG: heavy-metal-associated domain-containing protein, partial [Deltaproteobacteria bacterium]|nr:heavy-metal-associated domain-containing protein [Deltaproteobacteria bacterium]